MKFNEFKFKKTICVLASSIIILTMSGCTKEYIHRFLCYVFEKFIDLEIPKFRVSRNCDR